MFGARTLLALSLLTGVLAQMNSTEPKPPRLTYLYTANATLGPTIQYGDGPKGNRVAIPIIGGTFEGPKMKGESSSSYSSSYQIDSHDLMPLVA